MSISEINLILQKINSSLSKSERHCTNFIKMIEDQREEINEMMTKLLSEVAYDVNILHKVSPQGFEPRELEDELLTLGKELVDTIHAKIPLPEKEKQLIELYDSIKKVKENPEAAASITMRLLAHNGLAITKASKNHLQPKTINWMKKVMKEKDQVYQFMDEISSAEESSAFEEAIKISEALDFEQDKKDDDKIEFITLDQDNEHTSDISFTDENHHDSETKIDVSKEELPVSESDREYIDRIISEVSMSFMTILKPLNDANEALVRQLSILAESNTLLAAEVKANSKIILDMRRDHDHLKAQNALLLEKMANFDHQSIICPRTPEPPKNMPFILSKQGQVIKDALVKKGINLEDGFYELIATAKIDKSSFMTLKDILGLKTAQYPIGKSLSDFISEIMADIRRYNNEINKSEQPVNVPIRQVTLIKDKIHSNLEDEQAKFLKFLKNLTSQKTSGLILY